MIVSGRGIEYGFSPLTHPDDFSNQEIKKRTREIARSVLEQLPAPGSPEAKDLAAQLLNQVIGITAESSASNQISQNSKVSR